MFVVNEHLTRRVRQFQLGLAAWLCLLAGCGPATISSGTVSLQDIADGAGLTVIAAELKPERQIPWTKPEDVLLTAAFPDSEHGRLFPDWTYVMLAHGGVLFIPIQEGAERERLHGLFTIAGGEPLTWEGVADGSGFYPPGFSLAPVEINVAPEESERFASLRMARSNKLKAIAGALHKYHEDHGHFPPAIVYGEDGTPWHSWRVLILPYFGEEERKLHAQYDFSAPWDAAQNLPVLEQMPMVYRSELPSEFPNHFTPYVVITGEGTAFPL